MNLLFYTSFKVSEQQGGTERVTARISNVLRQRGYHCFSAYGWDIDDKLPVTEFDGVVNTHETSLEQYVIEQSIDVVIVQTMTRDVRRLRSFINQKGLKTKIISVLHFNPGYEERKLSFKNFLQALRFRGRLIQVVAPLLYPVYKWAFPKRNRELYRCVYEYSHHVVVLSASFIDEYADYAGLSLKGKLMAIPNPLSYADFLREDELKDKKKQVLIVSRMDETQKRISLALKIWKQIETDKSLADWELKIVGDGPDLPMFRQLAQITGLHRVAFCGVQEPKSYYEESKIFIMTSLYEGWGLTLTEAQQFGCVPMAFDTYSSLHDIIEDGKNGYVINEGDLDGYVAKLRNLMKNESALFTMALSGLKSCHQFEISKIIDRWVSLFTYTTTN